MLAVVLNDQIKLFEIQKNPEIHKTPSEIHNTVHTSTVHAIGSKGSVMPITLDTALEALSNHRTNNSSASNQIVQDGKLVLQSKSGLKKLGDEQWSFLEKLILAAIDIGDLALADNCLNSLVEKFPDSPRVDILQGIRLEATALPDKPERAFHYYDELLLEDESNAAAWKRKIIILHSILPPSPSPSEITPLLNELTTYLDTFYSDIPGWLLLSSIYTSVGQLTKAFQSISHVLVLAPQNPWMVLQAAQIAWDAGDVWGALRMWLRAGEMAVEDVEAPVLDPTKKIEDLGEDLLSGKCWYGVKLATRSILNSSRRVEIHGLTQSKPMSDENVKLLDQLATERLLVLYPPESTERKELMEWMKST